MPRKQTTTADSELEELPDFSDAPGQNGTVTEVGDCLVPDPDGNQCAYEAFHTGLHSWDSAIRVEQPVLPALPVAMKRGSSTAIVIPEEAEFVDDNGGVDFLRAGAVGYVADDLIETYPELSHLREGVTIAYLWKRAGGRSKGKPTLGKCQKPAGLLAHFAGVAYVIWLAADHARTFQLSAVQLEALLFHELMHTDEDSEEDAAEPHLTVRGHDVEEHVAVLRRYGLWMPELREMATTIRQLALSEAIA